LIWIEPSAACNSNTTIVRRAPSPTTSGPTTTETK
jgi:hypothetical protein